MLQRLGRVLINQHTVGSEGLANLASGHQFRSLLIEEERDHVLLVGGQYGIAQSQRFIDRIARLARAEPQIGRNYALSILLEVLRQKSRTHFDLLVFWQGAQNKALGRSDAITPFCEEGMHIVGDGACSNSPLLIVFLLRGELFALEFWIRSEPLGQAIDDSGEWDAECGIFNKRVASLGLGHIQFEYKGIRQVFSITSVDAG